MQDIKGSAEGFNMKTKNYCPQCDKETQEAYEIPSGDYVCLDCYTGMTARGEEAYEAWKEEGRSTMEQEKFSNVL